MTVRLGEVMVEQGLLTRDQVDIILREQQVLKRPFGELAERLFGLHERDVEQAWARQYSHITRHVEPLTERIEPDILALVDRRQAWQFQIMPLRRDGEEIMIATVVEYLPRAMRFALRHLSLPCYFVISTSEALAAGLMKHYPLDGMTGAAAGVIRRPSVFDRKTA